MWNDFLGKLVAHHATRLLWLAAAVLLIITFLIIRFKIQPTAQLTPLHYNVVVGVDSVGSGYTLYHIPLVGLIVFILNGSLSGTLLRRQANLSFLSALVTLFVNAALLLAVLFLLRIT